MIADCEQRSIRINDWELNFIASIKFQLMNNIKLTLKQTMTLEEVWDKATERG